MSAQVARAGSWGFAGRSVLLLANFAATPFTIRLLGTSAYGLWALIQAVLVWAYLAEGGMGAATTKFGAECYAADDAFGESRIVWSALFFVLATTSAAALALSLGAHYLLGLLHVRGSLLGTGTWALRFSSAAFVVGALGRSANTSLQVRLRWKHYTVVSTVTNLVGGVGVPVAIYIFSGGVVSAAAVWLVAQGLGLVGLMWYSVRFQPALLHPRVDRASLRKLVSYGGVLTLANFAGIPLLTGERFFLAANSSTTAVAYYAVAATVATTLLVIPEQLTAPLVPALTRLASEGKTAEHRALYRKSLVGVFLVVTPATILIAFIARPFLALWAGPAYSAHGTVLLLVALVGVWANALAWVTRSYMLAAGRTKPLAWLQAVQLVPYLAAAWVLTAKWGALGAAIVWSARLVLDSVARFVIVHRSAGLPWVPLSRRRVRSLMAPALLGLVCVGAATLTGGLGPRVGIGAALLVGYIAGVWLYVLNPSERRGVVNLVREIFGREPLRERKRRISIPSPARCQASLGAIHCLLRSGHGGLHAGKDRIGFLSWDSREPRPLRVLPQGGAAAREEGSPASLTRRGRPAVRGNNRRYGEGAG